MSVREYPSILCIYLNVVVLICFVGGEQRLKTKGERFVIREMERGRKMGRDKERETMGASSIDFISAFPPLNRQNIFQKQSRLVALYPPMLYLLLLLH